MSLIVTGEVEPSKELIDDSVVAVVMELLLDYLVELV